MMDASSRAAIVMGALTLFSPAASLASSTLVSALARCVISASPPPTGWEKRSLKSSELQPFSAIELRVLRNQIFARHGYAFSDPALREYFQPHDRVLNQPVGGSYWVNAGTHLQLGDRAHVFRSPDAEPPTQRALLPGEHVAEHETQGADPVA